VPSKQGAQGRHLLACSASPAAGSATSPTQLIAPPSLCAVVGRGRGCFFELDRVWTNLTLALLAGINWKGLTRAGGVDWGRQERSKGQHSGRMSAGGYGWRQWCWMRLATSRPACTTQWHVGSRQGGAGRQAGRQVSVIIVFISGRSRGADSRRSSGGLKGLNRGREAGCGRAASSQGRSRQKGGAALDHGIQPLL